MASCPEEPSERVLAPVLVMFLHGLLLADVVAHTPRLRDLAETGVLTEWTAVIVSCVTYLCLVTRDPGFLRPTLRPQRPPVLFTVLLAPLGAALASVRRLSSGRGRGVAGGVGGGKSGAAAKDRRESDMRELQPIGRAAFDALEDLREVDEDPGEEEIGLADIEASNRGAVAASPARKPTSSAPGSAAKPGASPSPSVVGAKGAAADAFDFEFGADGDAEGASPLGVAVQSGVRLRFCKLCKMYQPLRVKHCYDCKRCVRTHDHHCPWVGTCVAEGNRVFFYWFLIAQMIELGIFLVEGFTSLVQIEKMGARLYPPYWQLRRLVLVLGLLIILALFAMVIALAVFHSYLAAANLTTWETVRWWKISYLKGFELNEGSPFSVSLRWNLAAYCLPPYCGALCGSGDEEAEAEGRLKRTEDGWAIWEIGQQHIPKAIACCPQCDC